MPILRKQCVTHREITPTRMPPAAMIAFAHAKLGVLRLSSNTNRCATVLGSGWASRYSTKHFAFEHHVMFGFSTGP